ncbi:MAG: aminoglycoside phosphotransferase family protein [Oscillatoriales cyanobacterium]|uniref:phosphotransferase n=1 Tax=Microcoleus anatoxicus TaxID=2705319 RepID=UPI0029753753|nr:MAG: aminoglycoside phosphotransferase family protein [Oscillatoriales cyanobacterium]TAF62879.1 MAG: aminoglycoside phosphotransferase family protein [Oscillatoriales cyanobacterium]
MMTEAVSLSLEQLQQAACDLVSAARLGGEVELHPLTGGGNNRVFRVAADGSSFLLKVYFQHPGDRRDRLGTEFAFSQFAWDNKVRALPQPLACDRQKGLGLYEFVRGRRIEPQEVTTETVEQALNFYREINRYKQVTEAQILPQASEACFTIQEHLQCVERRLVRLQTVAAFSESDRSAVDFIHNQLFEVWREVRSRVIEQANQWSLHLEAEIALLDRCLSPSDFGFHNAILSDSGQLRFLDFEYAGWDDPGKMVSDFFCQPAVPVPLNYYSKFVEAVVSELSEPEQYRQRMAILLPVYRVKWCCILLNDFLPVAGQRRSFAGQVADREVHKAVQLQKARRALQDLKENREF